MVVIDYIMSGKSYKEKCIEHYTGWRCASGDGIRRITPEDETIIEWANSLNPSLVIDCGCNNNLFKGHIQNLVGFEIRDIEGPDYIGSYEDMEFKENSADIVMCLGSISYGDYDTIEKHLSHVVRWTKPNGFIVMRVKNANQKKPINGLHFGWKKDTIYNFGSKFNLELESPIYDFKVSKDKNRLMWTWKKIDIFK